MEALKLMLPPNSVLLFEDESDVNLNPTIEKAWGRRGSQQKVPAAGKNRRRTVFATVAYHDHRVVHLVRERKCSDDFLVFLEHLTAAYSWQTIFLVLDNGSCHVAKKVAPAIAERCSRLKLIFLPTYSPHLNVIEPFWRYLKRYVAANRFHGDVKQMVAAIEQFFVGYEQGVIPAFQFAK